MAAPYFLATGKIALSTSFSAETELIKALSGAIASRAADNASTLRESKAIGQPISFLII